MPALVNTGASVRLLDKFRQLDKWPAGFEHENCQRMEQVYFMISHRLLEKKKKLKTRKNRTRKIVRLICMTFTCPACIRVDVNAALYKIPWSQC